MEKELDLSRGVTLSLDNNAINKLAKNLADECTITANTINLSSKLFDNAASLLSNKTVEKTKEVSPMEIFEKTAAKLEQIEKYKPLVDILRELIKFYL